MNPVKIAARREKARWKKASVISAVRLLLSAAVLGSVAAGVSLGWADLSFDPRAYGAGIGVIVASLKLIHIL